MDGRIWHDCFCCDNFLVLQLHKEVWAVKKEISVMSFEKCGIITAICHIEDSVHFLKKKKNENLDNNNRNDMG